MKRFRSWWQGLSDLERLQVRIVLLLVDVGLISALLGTGRSGDLRGFALNFGTEMLGAVMTFWLLGLLLGERKERVEKEREEQELKARLIREVGSSVRDVAVRASEEMRARGWLCDGSLRGGHLEEADLQGAWLFDADLQEAWLVKADLQGARLVGANLPGACLEWANLRGARLDWANLQGARLGWADLEGARLDMARLGWANLQGAELSFANLDGASLANAELHENTILPDGTKWTPDTDVARFTNPEHPEFWRSDDPGSPAYGGSGDSGDD